MSFQTEKQAAEFLRTYERLVQNRASLENQVQSWMTMATTLHGDLVGDAAKRAEVIAERDAFVANLTAILIV